MILFSGAALSTVRYSTQLTSNSTGGLMPPKFEFEFTSRIAAQQGPVIPNCDTSIEIATRTAIMNGDLYA